MTRLLIDVSEHLLFMGRMNEAMLNHAFHIQNRQKIAPVLTWNIDCVTFLRWKACLAAGFLRGKALHI